MLKMVLDLMVVLFKNVEQNSFENHHQLRVDGSALSKSLLGQSAAMKIVKL